MYSILLLSELIMCLTPYGSVNIQSITQFFSLVNSPAFSAVIASALIQFLIHHDFHEITYLSHIVIVYPFFIFFYVIS